MNLTEQTARELNTMPRTMPMEEVIIRQSIELIQATIDDLRRRRDALAAALPNAPRPVMMKINPVTGREIKQGGGKKRKVEA